jgi:hypothetical protein
MAGMARLRDIGNRIYRVLRYFFGPAQLSPRDSVKRLDDAAQRRADTATEGWKVARDSTGRSYLVPDTPDDGSGEGNRSGEGDDSSGRS